MHTAAATLAFGQEAAYPQPWAALPKAELHLHLDCSLSFAVVRELSNDISPEDFRNNFTAPQRCHDLADFLARVRPQVSLLQTELALRLAAIDLVRQLAADGVVYAEIRFAPLLHDGLAPELAVAAVCEALMAEAGKAGIAIGVILCTLRHFTEAQSLRTAELALEFAGAGVVGLDLAGDEVGFDLAPHRPAFALARQHGLATTAHAGEASGPKSVWQTLEQLQPNRIGHGVRAIEDAALVRHLASSDVLLEVCPTCNVQIGIYPDLASHPVARLAEAGIKLCLNTDTRTTTPTTLSRDFAALAQTFGWTKTDVLKLQDNAVSAGFLDSAAKTAAQAAIAAAR